MKCFNHNERDAVGTCAACAGGGCGECLQHYAGLKLCAPCAAARYVTELSAVQSEGRRARKKLLIATGIFAFFFLTSYAMVGSLLVAAFNGYGWASVYLAMMPFVRFFGSRIRGGAISTSVTGALFGSVWFWVVAGWWLVLLGCVYAYLGGGLVHFALNLRTLLGAQRIARAIPVPQGFDPNALVQAGGTASLPPTTGPVPAPRALSLDAGQGSRFLLPVGAALVLFALCAVPIGMRQGNGCNRASAGEADAPALRPASFATPATVPAVVRPESRPVAPAAAASPSAVVALKSVADLLHRYYTDLNANQFEASRYFEPSVERYITMLNTSTGAMNRYIWHTFPKQFKEHHFGLEEGSLAPDGPNQYTYVETASYFQVARSRHVDQRYRVRVRVAPSGKLTFLQQFEPLSSTASAAPEPVAAARPELAQKPEPTAALREPTAALREPTATLREPTAAPRAEPESKVPPTPKVDCTVPYRIDQNGLKRMRSECNR